ncbi:hypothetical protein [Laspinema olomoucense]|uniref:hypothetical protein n=1 Tax=Laspinema olomoucense TaxID=3231600 RepID=UPI0021BB6ED0|nr:hypothetical protein [Laspinema sp. D3a]MCT7988997.1 hypothetical protein [Laspinema sp. D3a]
MITPLSAAIVAVGFCLAKLGLTTRRSHSFTLAEWLLLDYPLRVRFRLAPDGGFRGACDSPAAGNCHSRWWAGMSTVSRKTDAVAGECLQN